MQPEGQRYDLFASPFTHHWSHNPKHKSVLLLGLNKRLPNDRFCGVSAFTNSFGQPSVYAYVGKTWPHISDRYPNLYASLSAGIMYGYVDEYKNKVPLNFKGFSPGLIPALGYRITPNSNAELHVLPVEAAPEQWNLVLHLPLRILESLDPRPELDLRAPGGARLANGRHVGFGDSVGVEQAVGRIALALEAPPIGVAHTTIDVEVRDVDALGREFGVERLA